MFSNFVVAVSAVIPIFVLIGIGLFVKHAKLMTPEELKHTNRMVFRVFFFCMMFANIYRADFEDGFDPSLVVFGMTAVTLLFLASMAFAVWFEKDNRKRGSIAQAIFRSNFVILGIPIVVNIFGEEAALIPTMMIAAIVPLYNIFAVFELEMFRGGKFQLIPILIRVLKNPMIDGIILGALCRLLPFPIPDPILKPIAQVGAATTPVALIILGARPLGQHDRAPHRRACHHADSRRAARLPRCRVRHAHRHLRNAVRCRFIRHGAADGRRRRARRQLRRLHIRTVGVHDVRMGLCDKDARAVLIRQYVPLNYPLSHASRASSPRGRACCCLYLSINRGTLWQAKDHFFAYLLSTSLPSPAAHPPARSLAMALSLRAARLCATCIFRAFTNGRCCSCARMPPRRCSSFAESSISR